jgi:Flp pilus assembly protein TadG
MTETAKRRPIKDFSSSESGMAMVEWAMAASFFAIMLMGVVELGSAAQYKMQLSNAVRVGMQYASVRKPIQGDLTQITDNHGKSLALTWTAGVINTITVPGGMTIT